MLLCDTCWNRIVPGDPVGRPCPTDGCPGHGIRIDDDIALVIRLLNLKGYKTRNSCSGHALPGWFQYNNAPETDICRDAYIQFDKRYPFPALPHGFAWAPDVPSSLEASVPVQQDPYETQVREWQRDKALLDWAMALTPNTDKGDIIP